MAKNAKHAKSAKEKTQKETLKNVEKGIDTNKSEDDEIKAIEQELSQEIKKQKKLPEDKLKKVNNRIFKNIVLAIIIIAYLLLINIGALNIETDTYIMDLKVFSMLMIIITIIFFEISYKKDSGILCIVGIEILVLAIITLLLPTLYTIQNENYGIIVTGMISAYTVYYIIKTLMIYRKEKKTYLKNANDINEIVKKK